MIKEIRAKVFGNERINADEGLYLLRDAELLESRSAGNPCQEPA